MRQRLSAEEANAGPTNPSDQSEISRVPPNSPEPGDIVTVELVEESVEEVTDQQNERERSRVKTRRLPPRRSAAPPPSQSEGDDGPSV